MKEFLKLHITFIVLIGILWLAKQKRIYTTKSSGKQTSQLILDPYSITHVSHGILLYIITGNIYVSLGIEIAWELFENTDFIIRKFRKTDKSKDYRGDSLINMVSDTWLSLLGMQLVQIYGWKYGIVFILISEIFLYTTISDNMTINALQVFELHK